MCGYEGLLTFSFKPENTSPTLEVSDVSSEDALMQYANDLLDPVSTKILRVLGI